MQTVNLGRLSLVYIMSFTMRAVDTSTAFLLALRTGEFNDEGER